MADGDGGMEKYHGGAERSQELEKAAAERSAELAAERQAERHERHEHHEEELAEARAEAQAESRAAKETKVGDEQDQTEHQFASGPQRVGSYKRTMATVRSQLPAPARAFSRFIHAKPVERLSDAVGSTVARPDAILSGAMFAFFLVLALYVHARYNGYALRGSETIVAFIAGWLFGILIDIIRRIFRRRR